MIFYLFILIIIFLFVFAGLIFYYLFKRASIKGDLKNTSSPLLIFDFDGTICDNLPIMISIVNELADKYSFKRISENEILKYQAMTIFDSMKELNISKFKLFFILRDLRIRMKKYIDNLKPFNKMTQLLTHLSNKNTTLILLTSNNFINVSKFFKKHNINAFNIFCTKVSTFGKHKALQKIINATKTNHKDIYYIGDEVRDILACKKAAVPIIAVTWGYNKKEILKENNPDYICDNIDELKIILDKKIVMNQNL